MGFKSTCWSRWSYKLTCHIFQNFHPPFFIPGNFNDKGLLMYPCPLSIQDKVQATVDYSCIHWKKLVSSVLGSCNLLKHYLGHGFLANFTSMITIWLDISNALQTFKVRKLTWEVGKIGENIENLCLNWYPRRRICDVGNDIGLIGVMNIVIT